MAPPATAALLEVNLRALGVRRPELVDLLAGDGGDTRYDIAAVGEGWSCKDRDGKWIHGPSDPWREARDQARQMVGTEPQVFAVLRPGMGYQALALVDELAARDLRSVVLIVEDRIELLRAGLRYLHWGNALRSRAAELIVGSPFTAVESFLERHPALRFLPLTVVADQSLASAPACGELSARLEEGARAHKEGLELQLGGAFTLLQRRRAAGAPPRVALVGEDVGYLETPLACAPAAPTWWSSSEAPRSDARYRTSTCSASCSSTCPTSCSA